MARTLVPNSVNCSTSHLANTAGLMLLQLYASSMADVFPSSQLIYQRIPLRFHSFPSCIEVCQSLLIIFLHLQSKAAECWNKHQKKLVFPERNTNCTVSNRSLSHSLGSAEVHTGVQFGCFRTRAVNDPGIV